MVASPSRWENLKSTLAFISRLLVASNSFFQRLRASASGELVFVPIDDETECSTAPGDGMNVFSSYSGNAHRKVVDLAVFGSVGAMPLRFERYSNTRTAPQTTTQGRFGREGVWTHSYQWFLRDGGTYSNGQPALRLMNPTQKQFSLNRGASRKQFPISSSPIL